MGFANLALLVLAFIYTFHKTNGKKTLAKIDLLVQYDGLCRIRGLRFGLDRQHDG